MIKVINTFTKGTAVKKRIGLQGVCRRQTPCNPYLFFQGGSAALEKYPIT
jgi:hypothetical protein